ncbi:MAG: glycosyl hydrolase, partial [Gammaproteobacteria bacterium]|nr:glycosyl hydrolase [Gammaproteobacteria bacterium]
PFPGWDRLRRESLEPEPRVMVLISDSKKQPLRWLPANNEQGTHRVTWDLRLPAPDAIDLSTPEFVPPWAGPSMGPLAAPGKYSAQLFVFADGEASPLAEAQNFAVKPVRDAANGIDYAEVANYQQETAGLMVQINHAGEELDRTQDLLRYMKAAAVAAPRTGPALITRLDAFGAALTGLKTRLNGDPVRGRLDEASSPSIRGRAYNAANTWQSTQSATATQQSDFKIAKQDFAGFSDDLKKLLSDLEQLEAELSAAGAPSWR